MKFVLFVILFCLGFSTINNRRLRFAPEKVVTIEKKNDENFTIVAKQGRPLHLIFHNTSDYDDYIALVTENMKTLKLTSTRKSGFQIRGKGVIAEFFFDIIGYGKETIEFQTTDEGKNKKQKSVVNLDIEKKRYK